jgi:hypothetical protein
LNCVLLRAPLRNECSQRHPALTVP